MSLEPHSYLLLMRADKKELMREREAYKILYFQQVLQQAGIETQITNEHSSNVPLDLPEFWPALSVVEESDLQKARDVIKAHKENEGERFSEEQACPHCGESNPGNFEVCWSCGGKLSPRK